MPTDFTGFYGPWPFDDPPLDSFHPILLALNAVVGALLTASAAIVAAYWIRTSGKPLQFSLRTCLWFVTVLAGLMALVPWAAQRLHLMGITTFDLLVITQYLAQRSVYIVPCLLVVTTAHWMLTSPGGSWRKYRWARIHWLTWLGLGVMVGPFLHFCFVTQTGYLWVGSDGSESKTVIGSIHLPSYGWPFEYIAEFEGPESNRQWALGEGFAVTWFNPNTYVANIVIALVVIASTGFVVERWIRRVERKCPMSRTSLVAAMVVVAVVACILVVDHSFRPKWYAYPFWLFGIASAVLAGADILARGIAYFVTATFR